MRCAGFRGWRQEVEGWGDGVIVSESMQIRCPHENGRAVFLDFSTLRPVFKKVCFQALRFQDPCGRSAKTTQYMYVFTKEHFSCRRPLRWSAHKAAVALPTDAKVFLLHFSLHGMGVKRRRTVILHTCEGFLKKKKKALITTEVLSQWGNLKKKKKARVSPKFLSYILRRSFSSTLLGRIQTVGTKSICLCDLWQLIKHLSSCLSPNQSSAPTRTTRVGTRLFLQPFTMSFQAVGNATLFRRYWFIRGRQLLRTTKMLDSLNWH